MYLTAAKAAFTFMRSKTFLYGVLAFMVAFALYRVYDTIYERGYYAKAVESEAEIVRLNDQITELNKKLSVIKKTQDDYVKAVEVREKELLAAIDTNEREQKALREAKQKELSDVKKFITADADLKCKLSFGAVRLFNRAALPTEQASPPSDPGDVDAPGDVALSELGEVVKDNYLTCNRWRDQVKSWQSWYKEWSEWQPPPAPVN